MNLFIGGTAVRDSRFVVAIKLRSQGTVRLASGTWDVY